MACGGDVKLMEGGLAASLNNMQWLSRWPRERASGKNGGNDDGDGEWNGEFEVQMVVMGTALRNVLDVRLKSGREMLANLLKISKIRKLNSMVINRRV